jgi:monomeric isocitrate dehydrogenase
MYPLYPVVARFRICGAFYEGFVGNLSNVGCLLKKAEEEFSPALRFSPVEAEGELVQVIVHVLQSDRSLVRP